jgi:PAS domain-containing protein
MAVDFHTAQKTVAVLGRHAVDHLQTAYQESDNALRKLGAGCRDAIVAADQKKDRLGSRISAASKQVAAHLQKAWNSFGALGRSIADKPRMRREARWARENDLRNLLASSSQALVVTDGNRRLVAANRKALQLFGISEFNMSNFTIDAFLANVEIPKVDGNGLPFVTREDEPNRCKIRRLDGGLRVAECEFVADIVPSRDLYKFQNAAPYRITPPRFAKTSGRVATPRTVETQSIPVPNETKPTKKLPRHGVRPVL